MSDIQQLHISMYNNQQKGGKKVNKKTGDRRTRKTNKAIKKALVKLMLEKDITKITIKDIAEEADINRGTFYFHFYDVYSVLQEIEDDIIEKIYELIHEFDLRALTNSTYPFLSELSNFLDEDNEFNKLLIINDSSMTFLNKLKTLFKNKMIEDNSKYININNKELFSCSITFIASGTLDLYKEWLKGNVNMSLDELLHTIDHLITEGGRYLINKTNN